ncbi:TRAP transporter small permease [Chloroflexota bacterium]
MSFLGKIVGKFLDILHSFVGNFGVVLLFFIALMMAVEIVSRYILKAPVYMAEQFVMIMMGWIVFLLIGSVAKRDEHIRIGFFVTKVLGSKAKPFIFALESITGFVLCGYLTYWGTKWVQLGMKLGARQSYTPQMDEYPAWIPWIIVAIGMGLTTLFYLERIVRQAQSIYRHRKAAKLEERPGEMPPILEEGM